MIHVHAYEKFAFDGGEVNWLADDSPIIWESLNKRIDRLTKEVTKWSILDILGEVEALLERT